MDLSSFVTSIVTSAIIFILLVIIYTWLSRRPENYVVYYPNRFRKGLGPPENANRRGPFDWVKEAWQASERDVITMAGLDARVYMIFLRSMLSILVLTACYSLPALLAISATDNNNAADPNSGSNFSAFDNLAMGNVRRSSSRIWAFVIGAYWLSLCTYGVLWRSYKHVVELRTRELASPRGRPEQFTVLVRDIPKPRDGKTYAQEVDTTFRNLHPESYVRNLVVVDTSKVGKIWDQMEKCRRKVAHVEAEMKAANGRKRQQRSGWMGLIGQKVDAIEFYNGKIRELLPEWEAERARALAERQQPAAFAVFNSRAAACAAGQLLNVPAAGEWTARLAPDPRAVVWENLPVRRLPDRLLRRTAVYTIVFVTICFYMIPIAAISAVITLPELERKLPFLRPVLRLHIIKTILLAYLPQLALIVFLGVLPWILLLLSRAEGLPSQAEIERAAAGKYFYFSVFNVFLGITLATTLFSVLKSILDHPTIIINLLSQSLPPQATFFITFISLKFLVGYGLKLSRLVPLVIYHVKRRFMCKTEEELREAWSPGPLGYATVVPGDMVVATIALCYAIMAPMILPFSIAYFAFAWLVMQNQVLNVHCPGYESNGRMWPHIHARVLAGLFISQLTMLGLFGAKAGKNFAIAIVMVLPPVATLVYAYVSKQLYYPPFKDVPLSAVRAHVDDMPPIPAILAAYTPTCLVGNDDAFDDLDDKFEDARSNISSRPPSGMMSPA